MAKGDYKIFNNVPFQSVTAHPRRYGVMFNPSSSRSRLRIRDSGRRYSFRLDPLGRVQFSIDGEANWNFITSLNDPCTNTPFPKFISHENVRIGEQIPDIVFDQIAVGRGRIIGKEAGTDRLFHLYIDEMLRTFHRDCNPGEPGTVANEDAPVPPFNMKIDPEYFTDDPPTVIVPPEGTRNYSNHPGSLRLPVFNELLDTGISDVMLVLERARTWYLKDTRSQLAIVSQDDLNFNGQDLIDVFTVENIRNVLESAREAIRKQNPGAFLLDWLLNIDELATNWAGQVAAQGAGGMIFPAYAGFGILLYLMGKSGAITSLKDEKGEKMLIAPRKLLDYLANSPDLKPEAKVHADEAVAKLMDLLSKLMLRSRRAYLQRYGARPDVNRPNELPAEWTIENRMPTPNQPPSWIPVHVRTTYMRRKKAGVGAWKRVYAESEKFHLLWLAANADGSLMAFGAGDFDRLSRTMQTKPNGEWDGTWTPFQSGVTAKRLAHTRNIDGRLEVVRIANDNRVFHAKQSSPNSKVFGTWQELSSTPEKRISVAVEANVDGRLEAFAVGEDKVVWRTEQTSPGTWSKQWVPAFGSDDKLIEVWMARNGAGVLEAVGVAPNFTLWRTKQTSPGGAWEGWSPLYSNADHLRMLNIGRNQEGTLEVIGVADDNQTIWRTSQDSPGNWSGQWQQLFQPDDKLKELWVTTNAQGWLEVIGVADNKTVWYAWQEAPNGDFKSGWHRIEALEGRETLAIAPNEDGSIEIFGVAPLQFPDLFNAPVWRMRILAEKRYAIQYSKVLDIGIGSSHWSENWQAQFGGEIHALLAPRPLTQGERYSLTQYRFLNGPVIDGDAFNDGTTNFYMMVKLGPPGQPEAGMVQAYAILWFDEQTYFTQRYRLVHPTDDILGDLFSLPHYMRDNPEWYDFHLSRYWCPFRAHLINDDSRMVLRRNVIAVTGKNPTTQQWEIYTIVYNYGLCDHSWRWRLFPQAEQRLIAAANAQDQDPQLPAEVTSGSAAAYVVVNMIDMRDDTFLHVRGSLRNPATNTLRVGRWLQRYLPANCQHVPDRHALTGAKPAIGYDHKWDFITEAAYKRADKFYQFGVYEDLIDSRGQYYQVELLPSPGGTPTFADVNGRVWKNDDTTDGEDRLRMHTINFNWSLEKEDGAIVRRMSSPEPLDPDLYVHEFRKRKSISMYETTARFRILERKPLGLIAVFYDKRDDELQSASSLPQPTTLSHDTIEADIPETWKTEDGEPIPPSLPAPAFPNIRVRFKSNHRVEQPPNVRKAQIRIDNAPGLRRLHISFWTPQTEEEVCVNIWRVSLAAIDQAGVVFPMFSVTRFQNFVRRAFPDAPVPSGFRGELGDAWRYDFAWDFAREIEANVRRFCTANGHIEFGTSLWFEDIVGHRALPEELIFT
ncbi:MAG TPA: hypothetical protein VM941_06295 [Pyrinomonadaceae bacterium]|jgi:hypothetical protein|nr:hypothetical protein [Pyrinomonadaceae bacterium]